MRPVGYRKRRERGAVGVMTPVMLVFSLGFAAIATDVARLMIVRNELQNAADAAALVGAGGLYPGTPAPNWTNGVNQGDAGIALNATEGVRLVSGQVQAGYWDLSRTKSGLQSQTITPGANDVPAVQVTVSRSAGNNNGPVSMLLAAVFGVPPLPVQATAVAVVAAPGSVGVKGLFPIAISSCMYDLYWDKTTGKPLLDPKTNSPYVIDMDTSYPVPARTCLSAEWTGFNGGTDANSVKSLVNGTSSIEQNTIKIGTNINISSGVDTSVYNTFQKMYPTLPVTVTIPVVSNVAQGMPPSNLPLPVVAFAAFQITKAFKNGSHSYLEGHFVANQKVEDSSGGVGTYYGAYVPPRLAW